IQRPRSRSAFATTDIVPSSKPGPTRAEVIRLVRDGTGSDHSSQLRIWSARGTTQGDDSVPALLQLLSTGDEGVRARAAFALGQIAARPTGSVPAIVQLLDDTHGDVRFNAAYALGEFKADARSAIPAVRQRMEDDADEIAAF